MTRPSLPSIHPQDPDQNMETRSPCFNNLLCCLIALDHGSDPTPSSFTDYSKELEMKGVDQLCYSLCSRLERKLGAVPRLRLNSSELVLNDVTKFRTNIKIPQGLTFTSLKFDHDLQSGAGFRLTDAWIFFEAHMFELKTDWNGLNETHLAILCGMGCGRLGLLPPLDGQFFKIAMQLGRYPARLAPATRSLSTHRAFPSIPGTHVCSPHPKSSPFIQQIIAKEGGLQLDVVRQLNMILASAIIVYIVSMVYEQYR